MTIRNFRETPFQMVLRRMLVPYVDSTFIVFTDKAYIWYSVSQAKILINSHFFVYIQKCHKMWFYSKTKSRISTKTRIVGFDFIRFMKGRLFSDTHHQWLTMGVRRCKFLDSSGNGAIIDILHALKLIIRGGGNLKIWIGSLVYNKIIEL